ncbi:MAG: siderophore-interacting protein [Roseovarius sp.]
MSDTHRSRARFDGAPPEGLLRQTAGYLRAYDLPIELGDSALSAMFSEAYVELSLDVAGFSLDIQAGNSAQLHQAREGVLVVLDQISPEACAGLEWTGEMARNVRPPNFHLVEVRNVRRVSKNFLRVTMSCERVFDLLSGGMHFSLLLPPGPTPRWPEVNEKGRTVWPSGAEALHRAAYTFVELDAVEGWFSFDVFEHAGGRATGWARAAKPGDVVGVMGPGGGDFPQSDHMLMGGDETAIPAIRRILEEAPQDRRGEVFIEVADPADRCPLTLPEGMRVTWLRQGGDRPLLECMLAADLPGPEESRFVWFAGEAGVVRSARRYFREDAGLGRQEMYLSAYWTA